MASDTDNLDLIVEELDNGFRFKDPVVEIKIVKDIDTYQVLWTADGKTSVHPLSKITNQQEAYRAFRQEIRGYWQNNLGFLFEINNKERIEEIFKPLAKYQ